MCTRRLDRELTDRWISATKTIGLERASDKVRIERYAELTNTAWRQLDFWHTSVLSETGSAIHRTSDADVGTRTFNWGDDFKGSLSEVSRPTKLQFPITDPLRNKDSRIDVVHRIRESQLAKLGWPASFSTRRYDIQLFVLPNARVVEFGYDTRGGVVIADNLVCQDICYEHHLIDIMGHFLDKAAHRVEPIAFAPVSTCPLNYYHELIDTFGSMLFYVELGMDIPIVIPKPMDRFLPLFRGIGIDPDRIRTYNECADVRFERLIYADRVPIGSLLNSFLRKAADGLSSKANANSHIYISRKKVAHRRLANEEEVETVLLSMGFDVLVFEDMPIAEQIQRMRDARIVVAPHGAGLANMMFSEPGTVIVEFIPADYRAGLFCYMADACGHVYVPLVGSSFATIGNQFSGWEVDIGMVADVISRLVDMDKPSDPT